MKREGRVIDPKLVTYLGKSTPRGSNTYFGKVRMRPCVTQRSKHAQISHWAFVFLQRPYLPSFIHITGPNSPWLDFPQFVPMSVQSYYGATRITSREARRWPPFRPIPYGIVKFLEMKDSFESTLDLHKKWSIDITVAEKTHVDIRGWIDHMMGQSFPRISISLLESSSKVS